ncbi:DMT family transporter [bacterium]|nr:DMT family transporter [bacterium]
MKSPGTTTFTVLMIMAMTAWGGSWTSSKVIASMAYPEVLIFWRFLFTVISFFPIMLIWKKSFSLNRSSLIHIVLGALLLLTYNRFFFWGLQNGMAGAGGVLVTTLNPLLIFLFSLIIFRRRARARQIIGLILGLTGGAILLEIWNLNIGHLFGSGNAFFIAACIAWASLTIVSEKSKHSISPLVFSFYVYCCATVIIFPVSLPLGVFDVFQFGWIFWFNILYMAFLATTFATTVYFAASGRLGSEKAGAFIFLVPFSAVLISWWILHETPRWYTIVGGIIAMSAVYLINIKAKPHPQAVIASK